MPETNLPPLRIHVREDLSNKDNLVDAVLLRQQLPELPQQIRLKLQDVLKISPAMIIALMVKLNTKRTDTDQTENAGVLLIFYILLERL